MATNNKADANNLIRTSKSIQIHELSKFTDKKAIMKQIEKDIDKSAFLVMGS